MKYTAEAAVLLGFFLYLCCHVRNIMTFIFVYIRTAKIGDFPDMAKYLGIFLVFKCLAF